MCQGLVHKERQINGKKFTLNKLNTGMPVMTVTNSKSVYLFTIMGWVDSWMNNFDQKYIFINMIIQLVDVSHGYQQENPVGSR